MKKVLAWVLLLTLVLGAFAGCRNKPAEVTEPPIKGAGAADAIEYLKGFYTDSGKKTPVDYTRFGIVRVGGIAFDVVWTVDVEEDLVKVVPNDDGTVTIDINEECEADTEYTLTATVTDAQGNTASHSWTYILPEGVDMVEVVKAAYALQPGESLPYESRLIGKIISLDAVWSDDYQNVTVTIEVEGAEDMPIKCYRMKANDSTLEAAKNLKVGNIITVSGILKNYEGTIEFDAGCILEKVEKGDAIEAPTDPIEIVKAAYALPQNAALPYQATLTGTVTGIDNPYDPAYSNISVVISIEGAENYPILCYRLKGTDAEKIAIGDLITVTGIIKNYNGTIEYDAGCIMTNRVSGGGVAQGPSSDPAKIIPDALALGVGEKLPYRATLTGEVYSVDTPYDPNYGNVTVTMKVNGVKFQCYRMVGDGIDQIRESDTITVSGVIENYNGKLEFGAKCTLDNWTMGPRTVSYGPLVEDTAYRLYMEQTGIGKTLYFNGSYSGSRLNSSVKGSEGADVFVERVSGKGVRFYYMDGETKNYLEIEEYLNDSGQARGRAAVTTTPSCYWVYNSEFATYVVNLPTAGKYFMGTYSTYETFSASWIGYIDGTMSGSAQFIAHFMAASDVPADEPSVGGGSGVLVTAPVAGVPYKWGLEQENKGVNLYFTGTMSGYYGATTEDITKGVDVILEETSGGYYITFKDASGAKKYINVVLKEEDGKTHRNFTIANEPVSVYTYNTQYNTMVTTLDGDDLYTGTYGDYNTFSFSFFSKISTSFPSHFYTVGEGGDVEPEPTEPAGPQETIPVVTDTLKDGDKVVIYAPAYGKALSADKVTATSYYNKGVDVTVADGALNGYGNAEIWTVCDNGNGTYSFAMDGLNIGLGEEFSSMNLDAVYDEWEIISLGGSLYHIKNVGRGMFMEWYSSKDNWSAFNSAKTDEFEMSIYIVGQGLLGYAAEEPEPTEPEATEPSTGVGIVTEPEVGVAYKWGIEQDNIGKTLYFNGGMAKTYYGGTTESFDEAVDVYLEAADNGYYVTFNNDSGAKKYITIVVNGTHRNFTIADKASNVYTWNEEYNTLQTDVDGTACYFGTYSTFDTFSVSSLDKIGTSFPAHFYAEGQGTEPEVTEPEATEPEATEPSTGDGFNKITSADQFTSGKYVMIVNTGYAPGVFDNNWLSAAQPTVSGNAVTDTDGAVWTLTVNGSSVVLTDSNGVTIGPKGGANNGVLEKNYEWAWTFENGTFVFAGTGADAVYLASNTYTTGQYPGNHRFRGYKTTTINDHPDEYPWQFTLYKLGGEYVEPEVTEPEVTQPSGGEVGVVDPEVGKAYKFGIVQENVGTDVYYITGEKNNYYMDTTTDAAAAADVYLEAANGGYYLYTTAGGAKKYINMVVSGTHVNAQFENSATTVYTYDAEKQTVISVVNGAEYWHGTRNDMKYTTIGPVKVEYNGFYAKFYAVGEGSAPDATEPEETKPSGGESAELEVGVAYKLYSEQANVKKTLYFAGTTANQDYYFSTTEDPAAATDVYLEAANGGYYLYFMKDGAKTYIDMVQSGTFYNLKMTSKPGVVYTYDSQYKTLVANVAGTQCYMGTYKQYETLSCSAYSYISGSFPCHFTKDGQTVEPDVTEPEETTPSVGGESVSVNFQEFPKGVQYEPETYDLGGGITLDINHCHMNSQLRIYQDAKNGYDGKAIFSCGKVLQSITLNAGYRASGLQVYGSVDGKTWELITEIAHPTEGVYADYTVVMPAGSNYKYVMLDAPSTQMRVKTMTFIFKK